MTQISIPEWYDEYTSDNPEACLGLIQNSNPQYKRIGSTKSSKLYCIGYLVYARTIPIHNAIKVNFVSGSQHFPKMKGLSVIVDTDKNNIYTIREAVKMITTEQIQSALKEGEKI